MDRPGGYTRILKTGNRFGDNAEMCLIELVDYNEAMLSVKDDGKEKVTRRRRGGSKKKTGDDVEAKAVQKPDAGPKQKTAPEIIVAPVVDAGPEEQPEAGVIKPEA